MEELLCDLRKLVGLIERRFYTETMGVKGHLEMIIKRHIQSAGPLFAASAGPIAQPGAACPTAGASRRRRCRRGKSRHGDPSTSARAARVMRGKAAKTCEQKILEALRTFGANGAAQDVACERAGVKYPTGGARFKPLERKRLAFPTDEERKSLTSTCMRVVWVAAEFLPERLARNVNNPTQKE
jgi:hypothetical protein